MAAALVAIIGAAVACGSSSNTEFRPGGDHAIPGPSIMRLAAAVESSDPVIVEEFGQGPFMQVIYDFEVVASHTQTRGSSGFDLAPGSRTRFSSPHWADDPRMLEGIERGETALLLMTDQLALEGVREEHLWVVDGEAINLAAEAGVLVVDERLEALPRATRFDVDVAAAVTDALTRVESAGLTDEALGVAGRVGAMADGYNTADSEILGPGHLVASNVAEDDVELTDQLLADESFVNVQFAASLGGDSGFYLLRLTTPSGADTGLSVSAEPGSGFTSTILPVLPDEDVTIEIWTDENDVDAHRGHQRGEREARGEVLVCCLLNRFGGYKDHEGRRIARRLGRSDFGQTDRYSR